MDHVISNSWNEKHVFVLVFFFVVIQYFLNGFDCCCIVEAGRGLWISPFSENVKMKVIATSSQTCKVVVESSSRSILNLLNFGANKGNVSDLSDYINNEVYKLTQPGEIPMREDPIKFR